MFTIGDYAVCPGHGVGQVCSIDDRQFGEQTKSFYSIKLISNGMTVMVPTDSENGSRKLVDGEEVNAVYGLLQDHDIKIDKSTWNRRHREYLNKIKTGSITEIAEVLRALFLLKSVKSLSFGEKKMLEQCRDMIAEEIALSAGHTKNDVASRINACFN